MAIEFGLQMSYIS